MTLKPTVFKDLKKMKLKAPNAEPANEFVGVIECRLSLHGLFK